MKTTLAIVVTVLFMILAACGDENSPQPTEVNLTVNVENGDPGSAPTNTENSNAGGNTDNDIAVTNTVVVVVTPGNQETDGGTTDTDTGVPETDAGVESECVNGEVALCYDGPDGTLNVGICRAGIKTCEDGQWSYCEGHVIPQVEICNNQDNNCDGVTDGNDPHVGDYCLSMVSYGPDSHIPTEGRLTCHPEWATFTTETLYCAPYCQDTEFCDDGRDNNCDGQVDENCGEPELPTLLVSLNPGSPSGMAPIGVGVHVLKFDLQSTGDNIVIQGFMMEFHGCALGSETRLYRVDNLLQFGDTEVAGWDTIFETQSFLTATTAPVSMLVSLDTSACQSNETVQAFITGITTATTSYPVDSVPLAGHLITF